VYPDPRVSEYVTRHFVPVRAHVKEQRNEYRRLSERFDAQWTPTILIVDAGGTERHRVEGFLPIDDFLSQLTLGRAKAAFSGKDYPKAEQLYRQVLEKFPSTDAAAEAQYWAGVSRYRASNDPQALSDTARAFRERYQDTTWAKKASVWT
jgi:tetratricopeptide (TPR) repeat protein